MPINRYWSLMLLEYIHLIGSYTILWSRIKLVLGVILHQFELPWRWHIMSIHACFPTSSLTNLTLCTIIWYNLLFSITWFVVEAVLLMLRLLANNGNTFIRWHLSGVTSCLKTAETTLVWIVVIWLNMDSTFVKVIRNSLTYASWVILHQIHIHIWIIRSIKIISMMLNDWFTCLHVLAGTAIISTLSIVDIKCLIPARNVSITTS